MAFSATGLGLVIPILRDARLLRTPRGALVVAMASVAEFAAVVVLAVGFSAGGSPTTDVSCSLALVVLAVGVTVAGERIRRRSAVDRSSSIGSPAGRSSCACG